MEAINYLQINIIPILALIIMRLSTGKTLSFSWRSRALRFMMVLLAFIISADSLGKVLEGRSSEMVHILVWGSYTIYLLLLHFMAYLWYLYVKDVIESGVGQTGRHVLRSSLPLTVSVVLILTNPLTKLLFYIDGQNRYVRADGFWIQAIVTVGYIVVATARALYCCVKDEQKERRMEYRWLAYFVILPVLGGCLQLLLFDVVIMLPFTVASLLMVYINVQQQQVTRDGLTGLNNRGRLEQYLQEMNALNLEKEACHLLLIDVDLFKKINDTYGHLVGDQVLRLVAEQLKKVFGYSRAFIARYGGDEFVIILKGKKDSEVQSDIETLRTGVSKMNWGEGSPWKISISVGCAESSEIENPSGKELMKLADSRMYEEKNRNRQ